MHRYWSAMATLSITPVVAVDATSDVRPFTMWMNSRVMPPTIPLAAIVPPKHMAQMMSQMVSVMPAMPRVDTSSVSIWFDVLSVVSPYTLIIAALNIDGSISANASRWKMSPQATARSVDKKMVTIGGVLRAMSTPVATGTMSSHGVMLKRLSRAAMNEATSCVSVVSIVSPATAKIISARVIEGTVVSSM